MKKEMTEEVRKKLSGLLPVSKTKGLPFKPYEDEALSEYSPLVYVRSWTIDERKGFASEIESLEKSEGSNLIDILIDYSYCALIDIKNLIDIGTCEEIEIPKDENGKVDKSFYRDLPQELIASIFNKVKELSGLKIVQDDNVSDAEGLK